MSVICSCPLPSRFISQISTAPVRLEAKAICLAPASGVGSGVGVMVGVSVVVLVTVGINVAVAVGVRVIPDVGVFETIARIGIFV